MKFCSTCGKPVKLRTPSGDNRDRHVCDHCDTIHYQNPRIIAGCIPVHQGRVLLCRRAIQPRHGYWTLPAGFLENGETTLEGALRECWEEANAKIDQPELYIMVDIPHISQVYMFFRGKLSSLDFSPGAESLEVALFHEHEIPWKQLAFPSVTTALKHFFLDQKDGRYITRTDTIHRRYSNPSSSPK